MKSESKGQITSYIAIDGGCWGYWGRECNIASAASQKNWSSHTHEKRNVQTQGVLGITVIPIEKFSNADCQTLNYKLFCCRFNLIEKRRGFQNEMTTKTSIYTCVYCLLFSHRPIQWKEQWVVEVYFVLFIKKRDGDKLIN